MKYFDKEHRIGSDDCAKETIENQSKKVEEYLLFNSYKTNKEDCGDEVKKLNDFVANNHMNIREGYGFTNGCRIDNDSELRQLVLTSDKTKTQLFSRVFQGVPNLGRGNQNVDIENQLIQGDNTYNDFECHGQSLDVFQPMITCLQKEIQDPKHIIPEWVRGGESTRDTLKQTEFLEKNGYKFEQNAWIKKQCNQ